MHSSRRDTRLPVIALFKIVKAATLIAAGVGALKLINPDVAAHVRAWLINEQLAPGRRIVAMLARTDAKKFEELGAALFSYAALFLVEGCGLLARKRWAEWLTVIATASLIPIEIWECTHGVSAAKIATIAINVAVVVYLAVRLRHRQPASVS